MALSGAVDVRLPPGRTVLLEVGRSFTTMATPGGVGSFALTVRFLERLGIEVAAASASAALVSVGSLLVDLLALVVGGILSASAFQTENLHSAAGSHGWLVLVGVVVLAAAVAAVWHFPRLHRRVVPQLKKGGAMVRAVARRPRKALRLVLGQALLLTAEVACLYCALALVHQHTSIGLLLALVVLATMAQRAVPVPGGARRARGDLGGGVDRRRPGQLAGGRGRADVPAPHVLATGHPGLRRHPLVASPGRSLADEPFATSARVAPDG